MKRGRTADARIALIMVTFDKSQWAAYVDSSSSKEKKLALAMTTCLEDCGPGPTKILLSRVVK